MQDGKKKDAGKLDSESEANDNKLEGGKGVSSGKSLEKRITKVWFLYSSTRK